MRSSPFPFVAALALVSCGGLFAACGAPAPVVEPDAGETFDAFMFHVGPCANDGECPGTYCNPGSHMCCVPATPSFEICGDRIDQNCDRHDESCGDNDVDHVDACMPGEDPLSGCDCDDESADVRPMVADVPGAPELCDGIDNDCNGRIDEAAACCEGCASLGADRAVRADICTTDGACDCAGEPGIGPCDAGRTCCGVGCVDVTTDIMNCAFCRAACNVSSDRCTGGTCMCGTGLPCDLIGVCTAGACE
jgi:hypothetical protein